MYSAAKFHGTGHQQIQREYIVTVRPTLLDIKKKDNKIHFFTTSQWPSKNIIEKKSDAGIFKISSPGLTAVDLIHHQTKFKTQSPPAPAKSNHHQEIYLLDSLYLFALLNYVR